MVHTTLKGLHRSRSRGHNVKSSDISFKLNFSVSEYSVPWGEIFKTLSFPYSTDKRLLLSALVLFVSIWFAIPHWQTSEFVCFMCNWCLAYKDFLLFSTPPPPPISLCGEMLSTLLTPYVLHFSCGRSVLATLQCFKETCVCVCVCVVF